ncbi:competence type IV pilus assembly protein ComGB [Atopobacter phocae]|uniref:competence type IV pilus assembly protein ComGB n=1 Tax=Atopobacter phocae TaxID=136492 RepID=UPI000470A8C0|nr:competence type IV pilus assembly protein ComGB [Atopobacter phocae]
MKWQRKEQITIYQTLGELLSDGVPLSDAFSFLIIIWPKRQLAFNTCIKMLQAGNTLATSLQTIGFPSTHLGRLTLAQEGSYLNRALLQCANEEKTTLKYEQELKSILVYPILLITAVLALLIIIRQVLLPQMKMIVPSDTLGQNFLIRFIFFSIEYLPQILFIQLIGIFLVILIFNIWKTKHSALYVLNHLSRIPFINQLIRSFITWQFTLEVGRLLEQGISFNRLLNLLERPPNRPFIREMAHIISSNSTKGIDLPQTIQQFHFLRSETALIIQQGERINQQSKKMLLFSQQSQDLFLNHLKQLMQWLQPILFGLVAIIIISVYLVLLLPMLSSFESSF